jgi:hypothetical protein
MAEVTIVPQTDDYELVVNDGPGAQTDSWLVLDCESGKLYCLSTWRFAGIPIEIYHGLAVRWSIPGLKAEAANALMKKVKGYAEAILEEYDTVWDGSNFKGSEAGHCLIDKIGELCSEGLFDEHEISSLCEAGDWFSGIGTVESQRWALGIFHDTTDERISEIAEDAQHEAGNTVINDPEKYLKELRETAIEALESLDSEEISAAAQLGRETAIEGDYDPDNPINPTDLRKEALPEEPELARIANGAAMDVLELERS